MNNIYIYIYIYIYRERERERGGFIREVCQFNKMRGRISATHLRLRRTWSRRIDTIHGRVEIIKEGDRSKPSLLTEWVVENRSRVFLKNYHSHLNLSLHTYVESGLNNNNDQIRGQKNDQITCNYFVSQVAVAGPHMLLNLVS